MNGNSETWLDTEKEDTDEINSEDGTVDVESDEEGESKESSEELSDDEGTESKGNRNIVK